MLLAYVGLPRLQEVLSKIYVPDYFIGRSLTDVGVLGDPINLALDGSEADIHAAMTRAGWVRAEELTIRSSWGIVLSSVLRRPYPEAPVSSLFLFGQRQAFAYQQEVDGNASQRHHVRFWPVPDGWRLPGGFQVGWLAAATYDKAVGISLFTLQVTHRVDADIDIERDYVIDTVRYVEPRSLPARHQGVLQRLHHPQRRRRRRAHRRKPADPGPDRPPCAGAGPGGARDRCVVACGVAPGAAAEPPRRGGDEHGQGRDHTDRCPSSRSSEGDGPPAQASTLELTVMGAGALCLIGLWVFMLAHHAWARIALMVVCTVEAVTQLIDLSAVDEVRFLVLMSTAITVLILIAVSSDEARRWVRLGRRG